MEITDVLARMGGIESIARELGVSEAQAANGAEALIPAILGGLKKQTRSQPGGLDALGGLLAQLGGGGLLDDVLAPQPTHVDRGNEVLAQIFGSKDVSRTVAQNAAAESGLDSSLLRRMLPMLAMLVAGYMARQPGTSTGVGAGGAAQAAPASGGLGSLFGGLASMLDLNGDGNPLDDILRMASKGTSPTRG